MLLHKNTIGRSDKRKYALNMEKFLNKRENKIQKNLGVN